MLAGNTVAVGIFALLCLCWVAAALSLTVATILCWPEVRRFKRRVYDKCLRFKRRVYDKCLRLYATLKLAFRRRR